MYRTNTRAIEPDLLKAYDREASGIPIGRAPEVDLRNNHIQYIFTWYVTYGVSYGRHTNIIRRDRLRR